MKILQLPEKLAAKEWHYSFSIFHTDNDGTEMNPFEQRATGCTSIHRSETRPMIETYVTFYEAKEVYVQPITERNERD
jgi:hypothetical protein